MIRTILCIVFLFFSSSLSAQYYLRGEVRDQRGQPLANVKILLHSKGAYPYYSGSGGGFGIPTAVAIDTITLMAEGYETIRCAIKCANYATFSLKLNSAKSNSTKFTLSSITKNLLTYSPYTPSETGESYSTTVENVFVDTKQYPETGVALNVDRASYSNIRRFLNLKNQVPKEAVRIEEMLNYFNLKTKNTTSQTEDFTVQTALTSCPWNEENQLFFINLQAKKINLDKTPPSNLVFLIDVSGSMDMPNRLPLLKSGFKLLAENLRAIDTVSIITYGSEVSVRLQPTSGADKQKIISAIEELSPAGATAGESAIRLAYTFAKNTFIEGGNNRVILATDGDFNVGAISENELEELITKQRQTGIYLTCLGVGMGNYKDSKLEILAKKGNGNFAYIDSEREAEKVLVEEFAQTVYTVANDVFLNITFNPDLVKEYKLIGFNNPQNAIADSSVELEGGEVGSGHSLMVAFEIVPTQSNMHHDPNLKDNVATLNLSYKNINSTLGKNLKVNAPFRYTPLSEADSTLRFASSVIMFGGMLKNCRFVKNHTWDDIKNLAITASSSGNLLQMEFLEMIQTAKKIYAAKKK